MSLNMDGGRLLAEALADAMDRDLAAVPPGEQLVRQHRFSGKFVRGMKKIKAGEYERGKTADFRRLGGLAKRYGGLAAVLACVIGLAAVSGAVSRSSTLGCGSSDMAAPESMEEEKSDASAGDAAMEEPADENANTAEGEPSVEEASGDDDEVPADEPETLAPDWQEQLLAESAEADKIAGWRLGGVYGDGTVSLETEAGQTLFDSGMRPVRISAVYEVYYEQGPDNWERVYYTSKRDVSKVESAMIWEDVYALDELNMKAAGSYRLVRQVNQYRQVLQLTLDER